MIDGLLNRVRMEAQQVASAYARPLMGAITSYDPVQHAAKVLLSPEGSFPEQPTDTFESDWIPLMVPWSGNQWGSYSPPSPGDQVKIAFIDGDHGSGIIVGRVYDTSHVPLQVPSGEMWDVHAKGQYAKQTNDGKLQHHSTVLVPTGNLTETLHKLVHDEFQALFNTHTHGGAPPDQQMTDAQMTAVLQGN